MFVQFVRTEWQAFYVLMLYLMQQFAAVGTGHANIGKDDGRGLSLEDFSRWHNPDF